MRGFCGGSLSRMLLKREVWKNIPNCCLVTGLNCLLSFVIWGFALDGNVTRYLKVYNNYCVCWFCG